MGAFNHRVQRASASSGFWARPVYDRCPACGQWSVVALSDQPEIRACHGGACSRCHARHYAARYQPEDGQPGYPLAERGPCARCCQPCHRYGKHGSPLCTACQQTSGNNPANRPQPRGQEPQEDGNVQ